MPRSSATLPTMRLLLALPALAALAACGGARQADRQGSVQPRPTPSVAAAATPLPTPAATPTAASRPPSTDMAGSQPRQCLFKVDGKMLVDGPCDVFPMGDGGYTLNDWTNGKPIHSHFAVVSTRPDGSADATWNADPDDDKAMDPLGIVRLEQGCWVNDRTRICAR